MSRKLQYSIESIKHLIATEKVKGRGDLSQRFSAAYTAAHRQHWLDELFPIPEHLRRERPTAGKIKTMTSQPEAQPAATPSNVF